MSTAAKTITTANHVRQVLPARLARRALASRRIRQAVSAAILARVLDPMGKKRAARRRRRLLIAGAASGALFAVITTVLQRRRAHACATEAQRLADEARGEARTAGTTDVRGHYRSRHGEGAGPLSGSTPGPMPPSTAGPRSGTRDDGPMRSPLDTLAAHAERIQDSADDEPGWGAHLGFGISGAIPATRMGEAVPTAGGDALGGTVQSGDDVGYADEIVTGAGEAISNSTTPSQHGSPNGKTLH